MRKNLILCLFITANSYCMDVEPEKEDVVIQETKMDKSLVKDYISLVKSEMHYFTQKFGFMSFTKNKKLFGSFWAGRSVFNQVFSGDNNIDEETVKLMKQIKWAYTWGVIESQKSQSLESCLKKHDFIKSCSWNIMAKKIESNHFTSSLKDNLEIKRVLSLETITDLKKVLENKIDSDFMDALSSNFDPSEINQNDLTQVYLGYHRDLPTLPRITASITINPGNTAFIGSLFYEKTTDDQFKEFINFLTMIAENHSCRQIIIEECNSSIKELLKELGFIKIGQLNIYATQPSIEIMKEESKKIIEQIREKKSRKYRHVECSVV